MITRVGVSKALMRFTVTMTDHGSRYAAVLTVKELKALMRQAKEAYDSVEDMSEMVME